MKTLGKIIRWGGLGLIGLFVVAQFIRPARTNPPIDPSKSFEASAQVPPRVGDVLAHSCNDCHSHRTSWPWYSNVAPALWLVARDVNEGRNHVNFSEWGRLNAEQLDDTLDEICKEVKKGGMPPKNYILLHGDALLSKEQALAICDWTKAERERVGRQKPAQASSVSK